MDDPYGHEKDILAAAQLSLRNMEGKTHLRNFTAMNIEMALTREVEFERPVTDDGFHVIADLQQIRDNILRG